jgi:AraC family transcriptional regulator
MKLSSNNDTLFSSFEEQERGARSARSLFTIEEALPIDDGWADPIPCSLPDATTAGGAHPAVEISPASGVRRRALAGQGMAAECVQCTGRGRVEYRFRAPVHLLLAYEQGECREGETFVEGLPRSTLRSFARKFSFVPAGHEYHAWHEPRTKPNLIHFYFDPAKLGLESTDASLAPRLFFENAALWPLVLKLKSVIEDSASDDPSYFEALGAVLILELGRLNRGKLSVEPPVRGGLAAWQQRAATTYIEQNFAERISLATLAQLVRLSPHHFCRSFKRSFGKPPHRYQLDCRIERAKLLLTKPTASVTDVALTIGFSSSSAFATAFRKATGITPTAYHRR